MIPPGVVSLSTFSQSTLFPLGLIVRAMIPLAKGVRGSALWPRTQPHYIT